ncbi:MAG: UDP-N-acetylenolpyruvoylglucosamine reductase [Parcubacteria group bacterium Gr01-1014_3]|nr:MAG: UDP-N-acetylenolpyruvoylglucosamine reductase [Parcubacteria group bacterium Gr01-1014_3]
MNKCMFENKIELAKYSNYKIGGAARYFFAAKTVEDIVCAVEKARAEKLPIFTLGGGTNLLISDAGFGGLVLKPEIGLLKAEGNLIRVGAGVQISELLNYSITKSLSGFEWAGGLPGTVGGAIRGNAGAFGGETKDNINEVVSLDISAKIPKIVKRNNAECKFGYRNSIFKIDDPSASSGQVGLGPKEIIIEAVFKMKKGDKKAIRAAIEEKIAYRKARQPLEYPNIGSIFKNVDLRLVPKKLHSEFKEVIKKDPFPVVPTAYLISQAGLKGVSFGGAMISPKHPNFIVNALGAKAEDVKQLIKLVKSGVDKKYGIKLEEEVIYVE